MSEYERLREEIAKVLFYAGMAEDSAETLGNDADEILSLNGICIKADDQGLPPNPYGAPKNQEVFQRAISDFVKAGFVKVAPKPKEVTQ